MGVLVCSLTACADSSAPPQPPAAANRAGVPPAAPSSDGIAALARKDYATALKILSANADQGDAAAQANLGLMYERGVGVAQNYAQALAWYRKGAAQGQMLAEYHLGDFFEQGRAVFKDMPSAVQWYRKAAEQGNIDAQLALGRLYVRGANGVPVDYAQAMLWLRKAAEQGSEAGQNGVGELYFFGYGMPKDEAEAARWYRLAAAQNNPNAEARLGFLLLRGIAGPKNPAEGARLLTKAAMSGSLSAQLMLAHLAEVGEEQPRNLTEAYAWYSLAARSGYAYAVQRRDALARQLSPSELEKAQARAADGKSGTDTASAAVDASGVQRPGLGRTGLGSGFVVGRGGEILTARHVVEGCAEVRIAGGAAAAKIAPHATADLALLRFNTAPAGNPVAVRDPQSLRQGEPVAVVGFPFANALGPGTTVTAGTLSNVAGPAGDRTFIQISAPVQPGNSGGPVLDAAGNVVGVVTNSLDLGKLVALNGRTPQNINFAVSGSVVKSFLETEGVAFDTHSPGRALDTAEIAAQAQRYTVKLECWK